MWHAAHRNLLAYHDPCGFSHLVYDHEQMKKRERQAQGQVIDLKNPSWLSVEMMSPAQTTAPVLVLRGESREQALSIASESSSVMLIIDDELRALTSRTKLACFFITTRIER